MEEKEQETSTEYITKLEELYEQQKRIIEILADVTKKATTTCITIPEKWDKTKFSNTEN